MMPIYATSTYVQQSPGVHKGFDYARTQNPTRLAFERCVADLEGGTQAFAFASGLAAIATVLECFDAGAHVVASDDLYGGTLRLFERVQAPHHGDRCHLRRSVATFRSCEAAIRPDTKLIWVETPTNPLLKLVDLERVAAIARKRGIVAAADNTFASPYVQRPLELGFDVVVHSTTKYLNGHSDMVGGVAVVGDNEELARAARLPAERGRRDPGAVRQLPGAARLEDAGAAHGAPLRLGAEDRGAARSAPEGEARALPGPRRATRSTRSRASR